MKKMSLIDRKCGWTHQLWRRNLYALEEVELNKQNEEGPGLKRVLRWWELIGYGFAFTVGSGIFVVSGQVANEMAGPSLLFSFLIAGFASLLSAFCYSEFAAHVPLSGSAYTFSYVTLGEIVAWFIGWNLTLEYAISASVVARSWANYLAALWNGFFPDSPMWLGLYNSTIPGVEWLAFSPMSIVIIGICTGLLMFGLKDSSKVNNVLTLVNLSVILFIIIYGAFFVNPDNWVPFFPYGASGVFTGAGTCFFSFIGFDSVTTLAGEVKNPQFDLPVGIIGTLGIVSLLYVLVSLVLTGMVFYPNIDVNAPLAIAFQQVGQGWASNLVSIGSLTTLSATTFVTLLGQPRVFYQMSVDGLFFEVFGKTDKNGTPVMGTLISGAFAAFFAFTLPLSSLTNMISIGTLMAFTVVCAGVLVLRLQDPLKPAQVPLSAFLYIILCTISCLVFIHAKHMPLWGNLLFLLPCVIYTFSFYIFPVIKVPTTFKTPLVPILPCMAIYVNLYLIYSLDIWSIVRVFLWTIVGLLIYFFYGIKHSRARLHQSNIPSIEPINQDGFDDEEFDQ